MSSTPNPNNDQCFIVRGHDLKKALETEFADIQIDPHQTYRIEPAKFEPSVREERITEDQILDIIRHHYRGKPNLKVRLIVTPTEAQWGELQRHTAKAIITYTQ